SVPCAILMDLEMRLRKERLLEREDNIRSLLSAGMDADTIGQRIRKSAIAGFFFCLVFSFKQNSSSPIMLFQYKQKESQKDPSCKIITN
ncbi:MAG: hypothetical protein LUG21_05795, partial [Clostridiales bacterium]|nr:hypothetical protein [Clostridiales bacterium]